MGATEQSSEPEYTYHLASNESVSEGIISAVSGFSETAPFPEFTEDGHAGESLEPLYHAIDPDALESLLDQNGVTSREIEVTFQYMGYNITATSDGEIGISRPGIAFC